MEVIGWIAAFMLALCGLPQAIRSYIDGHSDGISWGFVLTWFMGCILMLIYVFPSGNSRLYAKYLFYNNNHILQGEEMNTHCFIPDTQVKPNVPIDHLKWIGKYLAEKKPNVIIHIGDHWDMPSLSSYDRRTKKAEGARYQDDIDAGIHAMEVLLDPINKYNKRAKKKYKPRKVITLGNHEERIMRHVNAFPELAGKLSYNDFELKRMGFEVHDFLKPVEIDGVTYCHYFQNGIGKPWGGNAHTRLKNVGFSFTMGHQQVKDMAQMDLSNGDIRRALICGTCYLHDEGYRGYQGNNHNIGIFFKHEVDNGNYNLMEVSLDYLCRRYEGVPLKKYKPKLFA